MPSELFNLVEGLWWIGLGGYFLGHYRSLPSLKKSRSRIEPSGSRILPSLKSYGKASKSGMTMRWLICMAMVLILFGISDFVEMATGAWWQPWWLLVWKALCIGIGLILFIYIYKMERR